MLLPCLEASLIDATVSPAEDARAFLFPADVLTLVPPAVVEGEDTMPMHLVGLPLASVLLAAGLAAEAFTMHLIIAELSLVPGAIRPEELSMAVLLPVAILTVVSSATHAWSSSHLWNLAPGLKLLATICDVFLRLLSAAATLSLPVPFVAGARERKRMDALQRLGQVLRC